MYVKEYHFWDLVVISIVSKYPNGKLMVAYPCDTFKNALQFALTSRHNLLIIVKFIILLWRVPKKNFEMGASEWAEGVL